MSASPVARKVASAVPISRRVTINSEGDLPNDLSSTPGGSLFSTTPGGSRIYYDRAFLLSMKTSPLARTPPANLPAIPGVTVPYDSPASSTNGSPKKQVSSAPIPAIKTSSPEPPSSPKEDDQFQLEL